MGFTTVRSNYDVRMLADHLKDPRREVPVVVVSSVKTGPVIDPEAVAVKLAGVAEVYLLATPAAAFELEDQMPEDTSIYGGGARSYPAGTAWMTYGQKSMVRLAYTAEEARSVVGLIVEDVMDMPDYIPPAPVRRHAAPAKAPARTQVSGTVSMVLDGGAVVKLDGGSIASIDTTAAAPGVPASSILTPGTAVSGILEGATLDISAMFNTPGEAVDHFLPGLTYPAQVSGTKTVLLFPGLEVRCRHEASEAEIVAVTIELKGRADGKGWKLAAAEGVPVAAAPPVLRGGGIPWIVPGESPAVRAEPAPDEEQEQVLPAPEMPEDLVPADGGNLEDVSAEASLAALDVVRRGLESLAGINTRLAGDVRELQDEIEELRSSPAQPAGAVPVPSPVTSGTEVLRLRGHIERLQDERRDLLDDLQRAVRDADGLARDLLASRMENQRLRDGIRTEKERASRARSIARENAADEAAESIAFMDPADQFRHEVYQEWVKRIPASSKADLPLAGFDLAPGFLASVDGTQGVDRSKVVAVAVEVLTGLAETMPGREMHRLRNGVTGSAPWVEDASLGTAWRVSLQVKTASARRLHFWRGEGGKITFANIGVHDDSLN
ncbi:hypothetical protein [Arthrobacter sp. zg-Y1110]|uniref:hypothetical protein n=1 Tax=Arthrobacter sp. zg-Y1110 TaxID=2886932 RepID=UPI001D156EBC|nr:hypothetical protein [Arthrobacter sp. zg-Y1110]MCC3292587.1 hypothetical protein [Arthrobacter sp. zg-Y1110]UWX86980.1 hypothetical protein N2K99_16655 [Arthrobacter sp. zg-Y1110]